MSATFYLQDKIVKHFLQNSSQSPPSSLWLALFSVEPTDYAGTNGTEVSTPGYARQLITFEGYNDLGNEGITTYEGYTYYPTEYRNTNEIVFSVSNGIFGGGVVSAGVYDAEIDGNMLLWITFGTVESGLISPVSYDTRKNKLIFSSNSIKTEMADLFKVEGDTSYFFYLKGEHFLKNNIQSAITPKIALIKNDSTEFDFVGYSRSAVTFGNINVVSGSFGNTTAISFTAGETWDNFSKIYIVVNNELIDRSVSNENVISEIRTNATIGLNSSSPTTYTIASGNLVLY